MHAPANMTCDEFYPDNAFLFVSPLVANKSDPCAYHPPITSPNPQILKGVLFHIFLWWSTSYAFFSSK